MSTPEEIKAEYTSSLADLTFNSRPLINVLTMLAEENSPNAKVIVEAIETHLQKVATDVKLPILYLIDCIVKNVGGSYTQIFSQNIVSTFCNVFKAVDEKTRAEMFKLRQTWNEVFPTMKLYAIDVQISMLDPAWPVTAKLPSNSIHFNPKFLKSNPPAAKAKDAETPQVIASTAPGTINKETLLMQEQLIQKQKELLELQQKKLELEVLQTKVKLQEQIKSGVLPVRPQNILLKPEVAKQLVPQLNKHKPAGIGAAAVLQQQRPPLTPVAATSVPNSNGSRIRPASSALIAAATSKPIRDPRLLRQQQQGQQQPPSMAGISHQVQGQQKSSTEPAKNSTSSSSNGTSIGSGKRKSRRDPRMKESKEGKSSSRSAVQKVSPKLPQTSTPSSPRRDSPVEKLDSKGESTTSGSMSGSGSTSSLDSPTKSSRGGKKSPTSSQHSSPSRPKRKDRSSKEQSKASEPPQVTEVQTGLTVPNAPQSPTFKGSRGSIKHRNYMRRNMEKQEKERQRLLEQHQQRQKQQLAPSTSVQQQPAAGSEKFPQDEDLRFVPPEKQPRLQLQPQPLQSSSQVQPQPSSQATLQPTPQTQPQPSPQVQQQLLPPAQTRLQQQEEGQKSPAVVPPASKGGMDVDLRQLPAVITKKRPSIESLDQPNVKKSKSEALDKLFGDEDTDLRQLPINTDRPPTPPPPIISQTTDSPKEKPESPSKSNLDAIRAKLANATSRDKVMAKSYNKKRMNLEDKDHRMSKDIPPKIIITPEDESCIKAGTMTKEQEAQLLTRIIVEMEKSKLKVAQKKDHEASFNVSLQPISDDELVASDDENHPRKQLSQPQATEEISNDESFIPFNDKDERIGVTHFPAVSQGGDYPPPFYPRDANVGLPRRFPGPWRGRNRGRHWDNQPPMMARGPMRPWGTWRNFPPQQREFISQHPADEVAPISLDVPTNDQLTNGAVNQDEIKSLNIDGVPKDIRFYDETAIVFINWDDPREITFQEEGVRHVTFNDKETYALGFCQPYKEVTVNGKPHLVRIGAPSRELFIDQVPYECYFGSAGIRIELDGAPTTVSLEGPPPQVKIGEGRRLDLVAGKISMFVDAVIMVPVFLDAKPQRFLINGETSTLRFVNALELVLINDTPFKVEYGGLPKPIIIHGKKHFIRFSVLPKGVKPGRVVIKDMEGCDGIEGSSGQPAAVSGAASFDDASQDSQTTGAEGGGIMETPAYGKPGRESPDRNSNSPGLLQNFLHQQNLSNLEVLTNAIAPSFAPSPSTGGYQQQGQLGSGAQTTDSPAKPASTASALNINELFQKLVASGFVTSSVTTTTAGPLPTVQPVAPQSQKESSPVLVRDDSPIHLSSTVGAAPSPKRQDQQAPPQIQRKRNICDTLRLVTFKRPETLKIRQGALYSALYSGMQCSSCGMRFSPEASMQYSQHLDWHFRQNRKGKKNARVAASRRWYYSLGDWKNYEELEDLEEREKNYFDQQQMAEGGGEEADEDVEVLSVPADPDSTDECCEVCRDKFDQFFHEEREEWHLKNAMRVDEKTYHPVCYDDYLHSLTAEPSLDETAKSEPPLTNDDKPDNIPGLEIVNLDDDDEEDEDAYKPSEEVVSLDSEESSKNLTMSEVDAEDNQQDQKPEPAVEEDGDDDDVILNEVAPIKIVVDDDEDDEYLPQNVDQDEAIRIKEEKLDDGFVEVSGLVSLQNGGQIKIKAEPVDPAFDLPEHQEPTEAVAEIQDSSSNTSAPSHPELVPSIDGNVEIVSTSYAPSSATALSGKIKINISKPLPSIQKEKDGSAERTDSGDFPSETYLDPFEPFPPGEEPEPVSIKPALKGIKLRKLPPVRRGEELTGLCSIM